MKAYPLLKIIAAVSIAASIWMVVCIFFPMPRSFSFFGGILVGLAAQIITLARSK